MEDAIRQKAEELGFSACAFTDCSDLMSEQFRLERWLSAGRQAGMDYMSRNRDIRYRPELLSEGCVSVIVLLLNYHRTDYAHRNASAFQVSEYALGRDYHAVMREKLHLLAQYVQTLGEGVKTRCCVDTAPVLEKALARRAGLGWIGRNTLLVTEKGSRFFIGEIFTSLPLHPDAPVEERCGGCNACVEACPAHALSAEGLDARRCLSYQTIERKELPLPEEVKNALGHRIYGCDVCQQVCPYNRNAEETKVDDFLRTPEWFAWGDEQWRQLTQEQFDAQFRDSAMQRIGYERLMENIRAASGKDNYQDEG